MNFLGVLAAQPQPVSPWNAVTITTAVIAGLSFLVAIGSLSLGVYNARHQSRRDFPKPRWKIDWAPQEDGAIVLTWTNEGRGEAKEVELWHRPTGQDWKMTRGYGEMPFGTMNTMRYTWKSTIQARLQWREDPNTHVVRTKLLKHRLAGPKHSTD